MKIYEHDGKKYVETGEVSKSNVFRKHNTPFLGLFGKVNFAILDGKWSMGGLKILRLATPEEIAGTEKMCPAGCGCEYANHQRGRELDCPWFSAVGMSPNGSIPCDWADAHWREFVKYEVGVDLGKEPSKSAGVRLTPESVGKAYRNGFTKVTVETRREGGYRVRGAYNQVGQEYWVKEDGKLADRCEAWAATFHNVKDKDLDLISEWDEKAEAGVTPEGAATPNACTAKKAASAPPAQPEILPTWTDGDIDAFMAKRGANVNAVMSVKRRYVLALMEGRTPKADKPDRRTEHVPVAKAWVNPAMLGR